jgi:two-component system response regulator NreC
VVRAGLRATLERAADFCVVAEARDVSGTLGAVREHRPALLVMDLMMPDGSTLAALPRIATVSPATAVVVVTFHEEPAYARAAIAAGAQAFVLKQGSTGELLAACRSAAGGRPYVHPRIGGALAADLGRPAAKSLSPRERDVVRLLTLGHTNAEIAGMMYLSERTIKTARARAMQKTGAETRAELVAYAQQQHLTGPPTGV